jgi:hypothetical protein
MRSLLPIVLVLPLAACSTAPPPPSSSAARATAAGPIPGSSALLSTSVVIAVTLPVAPDATHRYAFWGTSPAADVAVTEVSAPSNGAITVTWRGPSDAPIALHVVAYDADPTTGIARTWLGTASRPAMPLEADRRWSITLGPATTGTIAML